MKRVNENQISTQKDLLASPIRPLFNTSVRMKTQTNYLNIYEMNSNPQNNINKELNTKVIKKMMTYSFVVLNIILVIFNYL